MPNECLPILGTFPYVAFVESLTCRPILGDLMTNWWLAQVRPNADRIALRNLERQGFETFRPLERVTTIRAGRFVSRLRSFFPGYLFLTYPGPSAPWSLVNSTHGVARLVRFADAPAPVPAALITELKAACDPDGVVAVVPGLRAGSGVEVMTGTFTGFVGQIERLAPDQRAFVLIDFLGKETRVRIPIAHLKAASHNARCEGTVS